MSYLSADELAAFLRIHDDQEHPQLEQLIASAVEAIAAHCGQAFTTAADTATARVFMAENHKWVRVDPISSTTGLVVKTDTGADGVFDTTWDAVDYQLEPLNQQHAGLTNHPYNLIRAARARWFPVDRRARVEVTARWGWTTIPSSVSDATLMHAARLHERRNAPAGVVAGDGFIGRTSLGIDPDVQSLLAPFVRADKWT